MAGVFITGTDTDVGKTYVAAGLIRALRESGMSVAGMKPIASGCTEVNGALRSKDGLILLNTSSQPLSYDETVCYSFSEPTSPNIAARLTGSAVDLDHVLNRLQRLIRRFDFVVVEGVGGCSTPLSEEATVVDMAAILGLPVIFVVGLKLGCINHSILTEQALRVRELEIAGWIGNEVEPEMNFREETFATLMQWLKAPCLGKTSHRCKGEKATDEVFDQIAFDAMRDKLLQRIPL